MKTFKDSKDLISSCHHHLSEKVSLFSSNNEHLSKCVMIFFRSQFTRKKLPSRSNDLSLKKTKGYFGIDKDNTCSNENLVWDFWVIGRIHLPLMDGLLVKSFIKETFLFFIRIQWNFVKFLLQLHQFSLNSNEKQKRFLMTNWKVLLSVKGRWIRP